MRYILPFLALAIFACALTISYVHCLDLMHAAGMTGTLAHLGVIAFELTFAAGTLSLVFGTSRIGAALAAIGLGLAVVTAANVMSGVPYGVTGIAVGVAIPAAVVISEVLLRASLSGPVASSASATDTRVTVERHVSSPPTSDATTHVVSPDTPAPRLSLADTAHDTTTSRRMRIVALRNDGLSQAAIAAELDVSIRTVQRDLSALAA